MKKLVAFFAALLGAATLTADDAVIHRISVKPERILVAFYSWSGNTRYAAQIIAKQCGGTLCEIVPEKAYSTDYRACLKESRIECRDKLARPIKKPEIDFSKYDLIIVGTPNWYGTMAPPVRSFLAQAQLTGKTVTLFVTHGTGGMQNCEKDFREACGTAARVIAGDHYFGKKIKESDAELKKFVTDRIEVK